jgi:hypothetical protein
MFAAAVHQSVPAVAAGRRRVLIRAPRVLAHFPDEPVHQRELAGDLPGPPLVHGGPVGRAQGVVVRIAQVDRNRAPPPLPPEFRRDRRG